MRVSITPAFDQWLMAQPLWYPWRSLQATRNSIFCKWVIVTGRDQFYEHFPVLANSFSNGVLLQMLIQNGEAKPLPLCLSQVMDGLLMWGHGEYEWRRNVSSRLAFEGQGRNNREVVLSIIDMRVHKMVEEYFGNTAAYDLVWIDWIAWFNGTYKIAYFDGKFCFKAVAKSSFEYVQGSIDEMNDSMMRANNTPAVATEVYSASN
jgi:hypothetical protein